MSYDTESSKNTPKQTLSVKRSDTHVRDQEFAAFASCPRGLEALLLTELQDLGAKNGKAVGGGVEFRADWLTLQKMNLWSAFAGRIYLRVAHEACNDDEQLYRLVKKVQWQQWFSDKQLLRVDLNNLGVDLPNARFLQLRVKDAVCDYFLDINGRRPSISIDEPDVRILAALGPTHTSVYLDLSGENLFKRGWRQEKGNAPLKENLAAGMISIAQWNADIALMDPFCGSGTLLIEAACKAVDKAPGLGRRFGFEKLKGYDSTAFRALQEEARTRFQTGLQNVMQLNLYGSDITRLLVELAEHNAKLAGLESLLEDGRLRFEQRDARTVEPTAESGLIITNPPYGERLQAKGLNSEEDEAYRSLFGEFGTLLKQKFTGWKFNCLTADLDLRHALGLSPKRKTPLFNGGLDCRFFEFPLARGSYRPRAENTGTDAQT